MELRVIPKISIDRDKCIRVGEFLYNKDENSIFFELPFIRPIQLKITNLWHIEATPAFMKLPTIARGHIDLNLLCLELDIINFVQKDCLLIHGSCYEKNGKGILNVGFQNTGKTYQTYKAVSEGAFLVSEECTLIRTEGRANYYKNPVRSCMSWRTLKDCNIKITPREFILLGLRTIRAKLFPFLFEAAIYKEYYVNKTNVSIDEVRIKGEKVTCSLYRKLVYLTENEYTFMACDILVAYSYASGFNLTEIQQKRRELISKFVKNVNRTKIQTA